MSNDQNYNLNNETNNPFDFINKKNLIRLNINEIFTNGRNINENNISNNNLEKKNDKMDLDNRTITEYDSEIEKEDKILKNYNKESKKKFNGRWSLTENKIFLEGFFKYRNDWKKLSEVVRSRSIVQLRSHAQKFLIRVKKYIKNSQNENYVKGKIEDLFRRELNDKYDSSYLQNFTSYILKLFSPNNRYLHKNNKNFKKIFHGNSALSSYNLKSKNKLKKEMLKYFPSNIKNKNHIKISENKIINNNINNTEKQNLNMNNLKKNNPSLYINMLTVNYINSNNKKKENQNQQINQKKEQISNNESPNKTENCECDEFFPQQEQNGYGDSIFPPFNMNDTDYYDKFDESNFFGENWLKKY